METIEINLSDYINPNDITLNGGLNGNKMKLMLESNQIYFNDLFENNSKIIINIPNNILAINKSYLEGLFYDFITECDINISEFMNMFKFTSNVNNVIDRIYKYITEIISYVEEYNS